MLRHLKQRRQERKRRKRELEEAHQLLGPEAVAAVGGGVSVQLPVSDASGDEGRGECKLCFIFKPKRNRS